MRWTHGHTAILSAAFGGVALAGHPELLALGALSIFGCGVLVGRFWAGLRHAAGHASRFAGAQLELVQARTANEWSKAQGRRRSRDEQDAAVKHAYIQGATDQLHQLER